MNPPSNLSILKEAINSIDGLRIDSEKVEATQTVLHVKFPGDRAVAFTVNAAEVLYSRSWNRSPRYVRLSVPANYRANLAKLAKECALIEQHATYLNGVKARNAEAVQAALRQKGLFVSALTKAGVMTSRERQLDFAPGTLTEARGCVFDAALGANAVVTGYKLTYRSEALSADFTVADASQAVAKILVLDQMFPAPARS